MKQEYMITKPTELVEAYDEMLDETLEPFRVGTLKYLPSQVLRQVDPIVYREGLLEYADSLAEDGLLPPEWEEWEL